VSTEGCNHTELAEHGVTVLQNIFDPAAIAEIRRTVLQNRGLLRKTRKAPSAGHLAGFHRFAEFEPLHAALSCNPRILETLRATVQGDVRTIGLSDITVNRSQGWHRDLLRGAYRSYLDEELIWFQAVGVLFKALLYLQDSTSLKLVANSHLCRCSLASDAQSAPQPHDTITALRVRAGDVILLDLRVSHCGCSDEFFETAAVQQHPKILVSTVFGAVASPLTRQMELGNAVRQSDWIKRHWPESGM
jgi:hypothetical protein